MPSKKNKFTLTLVETITAITIFAVIAASTGSLLFTAAHSGARLADKAQSFQNLTWAMEYMVEEARWGRNFTTAPGPRFPTGYVVTFESDFDRNGIVDTCVWYWRGFQTPIPVEVYGDNNTLYRGVDDSCAVNFETSLQAARANMQELSTLVGDNPLNPATSNPFAIFEFNNLSLRIILTVEEARTHRQQTQRTNVTVLNSP